jgi:AhpD family alkylhydroperoxidase
MMVTFTLHSPETAPAGSRAILQNVEAAWNFIPNLHRVLAESPATLEAYSAIFTLFDKTSFTPVERQVIYLAINYENECEYCMSGHSALAAMSGVGADVIEALRENDLISNPRLQVRQPVSRRSRGLPRRGFHESAGDRGDPRRLGQDDLELRQPHREDPA